MHDTSVAFLRSRLHPLVSVLLVFMFIQSFDAVIRVGVFGTLIPAPPAALLVVILVGVSQSVTANILGSRRVSGVLPRARELILTLLGALVLLWILSGRPFRGDFTPWGPDVAWPLVLCAAQWLLTLYAQSAFRTRELFLSLVGGKTGHDLVKAAREASSEAGEAQRAMARLKTLAIVFDGFVLVPYFVLVAALAAGGHASVATGVTVRVLLQAVGSMAFIVVLNGFLEEQLACAAGVPLDGSLSAARFGIPLGGVAALFLVALVIAGRAAVLPIAWVGALLSWLSSLGKAGGTPSVPPPPSFDEGMTARPDIQSLLPAAAAPSPFLEVVWHVLTILVVAGAALGVVLFIIRPLLSRSTRRAARGMHPLRFLKERVALLLRGLARLPARIAALLRASGGGLRAIPRAILEGLRESVGEGRTSSARDQASLRASGRAVREFHRLARWGARAGVHFSAREGPMEYVRKLAVSSPQKAAALIEAAALVEELVYGESPSSTGERALARIVNGIVR